MTVKAECKIWRLLGGHGQIFQNNDDDMSIKEEAVKVARSHTNETGHPVIVYFSDRYGHMEITTALHSQDFVMTNVTKVKGGIK